MATKWPLEARLHLINEIFLVIRHNDSITNANGPKIDSFYLVGAILEDKIYTCTTRQRLIGVLKKSPVWEKIKVFLESSDSSCARKDCHCGEYNHTGPNKACKGTKWKYTGHYPNTTSTKSACKCPQYIKRVLK